jgi:hypothetical protein
MTGLPPEIYALKLNQLDEGKYVRDRAKTFDVYIATI